LLPVSVVVPAPLCVSVPVPDMALAMVSAPVRLITRALLLIVLPVPSAPVAPLPICKVPAEIVVVAAVAVGAGEGGRAGADLTERPGAGNGAGNRDCIGTIDRQGGVIGDRRDGQAAVVPPLPSCKVPAEIVVVPV